MSLAKALQAAAGNAGAANYIEDVFSTYLYTGNGSTQTITNGIDLAGEGGLVWIKSRSATTNHFLFDTNRGVLNEINSNNTEAQASLANSVTAYNADGFSLGSAAGINVNAATYASWTFRKQPKFFDVVTYTGTGSVQNIAHNLGSVPGCIIVKATSTASQWWVYHRETSTAPSANVVLALNLTDARQTNITAWNNTAPTSTVFTVGASTATNISGATYVAYIFAHDAGGFGLEGTDNVISCGSFTGNGSATGPSVNLGYEPQWVLFKNASAASSVGWILTDNLRGCQVNGTDRYLVPNLPQAETDTEYVDFTSTGFNINSALFADVNGSGNTIIYIAIRRGPMKVPTDGTAVFQPVAYTGTNVDNRLVNTGIVTDMTMARIRTATSTGGFYTADRLRGNPFLGTAVTNAEDNSDTDSFMTPTAGYGNSFSAMNGFGVGNDNVRQLNGSSTSQLAYAFKRAPGFFDEVCYTGTGVVRTVAHNLAAVPELMIVKGRSTTSAWQVYHKDMPSASYFLELNYDTGFQGPYSPGPWNSLAPTASVINLAGTGWQTNNTGITYVAYLFASCPGVSKVFSYTGNGSSQTINCGFTGGARFVMIKRTDSTGDWYVWDTARGIVSGNDPHLSLNTTAAEVTSNDTIDTDSTGFVVNQVAATNVNVNAATYIGLAIA